MEELFCKRGRDVYKRGRRENMVKYVTVYNSVMGKIVLMSDGRSLTNLYLEGQTSFDRVCRYVFCDDLEIFRDTILFLECYFQKKKPDRYPRINTCGTEFQKQVWGILMEIPYGETVTYKDVASRIMAINKMDNMSCQAIGQAVGKNLISIIIPCHRVVGVDGLGGYNGGVHLKKFLLELEG